MVAAAFASQKQDNDAQVVMITGCSSGGLGHALAMAFAQAGCTVIATARSLDSMKGLDAAHPNIKTLLQLDVTSQESRDQAVAAALERHGRIDILVNNAGITCMAPVAEVPSSVLTSIFNTNVFAPTYLIQAVVPHMIARRSGRIVNIGSVIGFCGGPWAGGYAASKAALHALSDSLRVELKPFGVHVIIVAPGGIKSNIEVNARHEYEKLPKWKFYQAWEHFMKKRMAFSQRPGSTSAEEFALKTVNAAMRRKPPAYFIFGYLSFTLRLLYHVPSCIKDFLFARVFGLNRDLSSGKKD